VFEKRLPKRIFLHKGKEVMGGGQRKLQNEELFHHFYDSPNIHMFKSR
jgi:hypothetical protein